MIGIISDIHGNFSALKAVLDALDAEGITEIISLGDVAGYYCQINECCSELRRRSISNLMGNHDWYLVTGNECPRSNSANRCLEYQRKVIDPQNLSWLAASEKTRTIDGLRMAHAGFIDPMDEYLSPSLAYFSALEGTHFISGHTHVQTYWSEANKVYCNPGSVGQPRDGNPKSAYAIWTGRDFLLKRVTYEISAVSKAMSLAGFTPYYYENLAQGTQIGGKISKP